MPESLIVNMNTKEEHIAHVRLINKLGLHARASAKLVQTASRFSSDIVIERAGKKVNAKSIMGVMMLAAGTGTDLTLYADGPDALKALESLTTLINERFGESE